MHSGLLCIIGLGIIAGYTGYIIGQFKLKHPSCTSMADAATSKKYRPEVWAKVEVAKSRTVKARSFMLPSKSN